MRSFFLPPSFDDAPASSAVAGIVISQARPICRTTAQLTWCTRRRPAPMPTTEEATTWLVDVGAPSTEAPKMTPDDAVWLASPSIGWSR